MGITVMPHTMVPRELEVTESLLLPSLSDNHVSLHKHRTDDATVNTLEEF